MKNLFKEIVPHSRFREYFNNLGDVQRAFLIAALVFFLINLCLIIILCYYKSLIKDLNEACINLNACYVDLSNVYDSLLSEIDRYKSLLETEVKRQRSLSHYLTPVFNQTINSFIKGFNYLGGMSALQLTSLLGSAYFVVGANIFCSYFGDFTTVLKMNQQCIELFSIFYCKSDFRLIFETCLPYVNVENIPKLYRYDLISDNFNALMESSVTVLTDPISKKQAFNFGLTNVLSPTLTGTIKHAYSSFLTVSLTFLVSQGFYADSYNSTNAVNVDSIQSN